MNEVYFDNAATSWPKPQITVNTFCTNLRKLYANPGRGAYAAAVESSKELWRTRETIAEFFHAREASSIVFTQNCTDALNTALQGLLEKNDHVITTVYEHNSVLRVLEHLKALRGIEYTVVKPEPDMHITPALVENEIKSNTRLLVTNHISNVTGELCDIAKLGALCRKLGIVYLVDAAQSAGSFPLHVSELSVDLLCSAGHKGLYGPMGTGILYVDPGCQLQPLRYGGTGTLSESLNQPPFMPEHLEAGTLPVAALSALGASVRFLKGREQEIYAHDLFLSEHMTNGLLNMKCVTLYSGNAPRSGIVSFNIGDLDSAAVADTLDTEFRIACRPGLHCAPLIHRYLETTRQGIVRFSFGMFNTITEVNYALDAVCKIARRAGFSL